MQRGVPDLSSAAAWALALTLAGYPVVGLIASALGTASVKLRPVFCRMTSNS